MARAAKIEVAAVNVRISEATRRDYQRLFAHLAQLRRGIRVYGDTYVIMTSFDEQTNGGVLTKYTEIEFGGNWFDTENFDVASPEKVAEINIPPTLKPGFAQFFFELNPSIHVAAFSTYSESKSLSIRAASLYFQKAMLWPEIEDRFGEVEVDIVNDFNRVERLMSLPQILELRFRIRRPNPDDIPDDLAKIIEERIKRQKGSEYEEAIKTDSKDGLEPDKRSRSLAKVAAENGDLSVKSIVNGATVTQHADEQPLKEVETYPSDEAERPIFRRLAAAIFRKVRSARQDARE